MRKLAGKFAGFKSYNTVRLGNRLFCFSVAGGKLLVTELVLGEKVTKTVVDTGVDTGITQSYHPGCCQLGDRALVMFGVMNTAEVFAALVSVGPGELARDLIHTERLEVRGLKVWSNIPHIVRVGESRVWASFLNSNEVWFCEIRGNVLEWTKSATKLPASKGFGAPPLCLPTGKLLIAGGCPLSTDIRIITPGRDLFLEVIGNLPEAGRYQVSTVLLEKRFVIGVGGWNGKETIEDMWIFDLETRKSSPITNQGDWHLATRWPVLEILDGTLYIIGGTEPATAYAISLMHLNSFVQDETIRTSLFLSKQALQPLPSQLPLYQESCRIIRFLQSSAHASFASQLESETSVRKKTESDLQKAQEDLKAATASLEDKDREIATLRSKLKQTEISRYQAVVLASKREKELAEEKTRLKAEEEKCQHSQDALTAAQKRVQALDHEIANLKALSTTANDRTDSLIKELAAAKETSVSLSTELEAAKAAVSNLRALSDKQKAQIAQLTTDLDAQRSEAKTARASLKLVMRKSRKAIHEKDNTISSLREELLAATEEASRLRQDVNSLQTSIDLARSPQPLQRLLAAQRFWREFQPLPVLMKPSRGQRGLDRRITALPSFRPSQTALLAAISLARGRTQRAPTALALQYFGLFFPGQLLEGVPVRALARRHLRLGDKLEDSWEARCLRKVIAGDPNASLPSSPTSHVLLAALNAADPMQAEALHFGRSRVRLAARASAILARAQGGGGIDGPARDFTQVKEMRDLCFDARIGERLTLPWLPRAEGEEHSPQEPPEERGSRTWFAPKAKSRAKSQGSRRQDPNLTVTAPSTSVSQRRSVSTRMKIHRNGMVTPPPRPPEGVLSTTGVTFLK